jgi:hypothetical protein
MADAMMRSNFDALRTALASSLRTVCATGRKYQRQKNREASPEIGRGGGRKCAVVHRLEGAVKDVNAASSIVGGVQLGLSLVDG